MTTATTFSRQNDAGSLASTLVLVVVLVLESKGLYSLKIGTPKSFIVLFFFTTKVSTLISVEGDEALSRSLNDKFRNILFSPQRHFR